MVIVVKKDAGEERLNGLLEWLKARNVTPRVTVGERQTILSGLKAGELVITGGSHKAAPGQKVNPIGFVEAERK